MDIQELLTTDLNHFLPSPPSIGEDDHSDDDFDPDDEVLASENLLDFSTPSESNLFIEECSLNVQQATSTGHDHYDLLISFCTCNKPCATNDLKVSSMAFAKFNDAERMAKVRSMLFATCSKPTVRNESMPTSNEERRKRQRRSDSLSSARSTTAYFVQGKRLCRPAFAALVQLSEKCIERHARFVFNTPLATLYTTNRSESKKRFQGPQKVVMAAFLHEYAARHGLECPTGRGSRQDRPLRLLASDTTKVEVHGAYLDQWSTIVNGMIASRPAIVRPTAALSYSVFVRYWSELMPTLRIGRGGSDFCDTCTKLKGTLATLNPQDPRYVSSFEYLERHREQARTEYQFYRSSQLSSEQCVTNWQTHLVFDFAVQKILLPRLERQPGQLHFLTGLKFDMFGIACSNNKRNYLFGLPEGHWPNDKTANVVISMLHTTLERLRVQNDMFSNSRALKLHADNCGGQNKNRFVLWYLAWRVIVGLDDRIDLYFLVAGHTKNVCDGAFGHVKRKLKKSNVVTPFDMMRVIDKSAESTFCVPSTQIIWRNWKEYLGKFFSMPVGCKISKFHVFKFHKSYIGRVNVLNLSTSTAHSSFNLLRRGKTVVGIRDDWDNEQASVAHRATITPLEDIPSAHDITRKNYLTVNILDRYYKEDEENRSGYFLSGADAVTGFGERSNVMQYRDQ